MSVNSDGLYSTYGQQMIGDRPLQMPVMTAFSNTDLLPTPDGMEQTAVWSSWKTGGSDRVPSNYPCALIKPNCGLECGASVECGKSLILRENSLVPDVISSADGTGYVTTTWLPPTMCSTRLGFATVSRKAIPDFNAVQLRCAPSVKCGCKVDCGNTCGTAAETQKNTQHFEPNSISQLFMNGKPLLHYYTGQPFYFRSETTPFLFMVPNKIMVRTGAGTFQVDTVTAAQVQGSCDNCMGF